MTIDINTLMKENSMLKRTIETLKAQSQIAKTAYSLLETRINTLEFSDDKKELIEINKVLFDILDQLVFLQLAEDTIKIDNRICPRCNRPLDDKEYKKIKVDDSALLDSIKKIQGDIEKTIIKYENQDFY
ncbi:MAG: hypothetical protein EAX96_17470 [Candidatus Lokiarchaeota archaeon]|nr:hypothetical protein [Candidatus Lokiarchaeota archaeon]